MRNYEGTRSSLPGRLTKTAGALALVLSCVTASAGKAAPACDAPRVISARYAADYQATEDRSTWKNGVVIHTEQLADATGLVVSYRNTPASDWEDSRPIPPEKAHMIAVLIGTGPVEFSVHVVTDKDSVDCREPHVKFDEVRPVQPAINEGATQPQW